MSEISRRLVDLARAVAPTYAAFPGCAAIACGGSAARGLADDASDLDLALYWRALPSADQRQRAADAAGGARYEFYYATDWTIAEHFHRDGVRVDLGHFTLQSLDDRLDQVLTRHSTDPIHQQTLAGLRDAVPLHGAALVRQWQTRIAAYPDTLAHAVAEKHLHFLPLWAIERHARARGDLLFFYQLLTAAGQNLLYLLCALNRLYLPYDTKHIEWLAVRMEHKPANFAPRLHALFAAQPDEALTQLGPLIEETLALVELHLPAVNLEKAKKTFYSPPPSE